MPTELIFKFCEINMVEIYLHNINLDAPSFRIKKNLGFKFWMKISKFHMKDKNSENNNFIIDAD